MRSQLVDRDRSFCRHSLPYKTNIPYLSERVMFSMLALERFVSIDHTKVPEISYQRQHKLSESKSTDLLQSLDHRTYIKLPAVNANSRTLSIDTNRYICMRYQNVLLVGGERLGSYSEIQQVLTNSIYSEKAFAGSRVTKQKKSSRKQPMFVLKEIATLVSCTHRHVEGTTQQLHFDITFIVACKFFPNQNSAPVRTGMLTKAAFYSICIFCCVPYLLTSLHITTSTAIRAVDDNQSAN